MQIIDVAVILMFSWLDSLENSGIYISVLAMFCEPPQLASLGIIRLYFRVHVIIWYSRLVTEGMRSLHSKHWDSG
jgi:hypothetical protein